MFARIRSRLLGARARAGRVVPMSVALSMVFIGLSLGSDSGTVSAAAQATTTSAGSNTDKARCQFTYENLTASTDKIRMRCFWDAATPALSIVASTTSTVTAYNASPDFLFVPGPWNSVPSPITSPTTCTIDSTAGILYAVGPGVVGPSGSLLGAQQVEFQYVVKPSSGTGTHCHTGQAQSVTNGFGASEWAAGFNQGGSGPGWTVPRCSASTLGAYYCGYSASSSWPSWGPLSFPITGASTSSVCSALTVALPSGVSGSTVLAAGDSVMLSITATGAWPHWLFIKYPGVANQANVTMNLPVSNVGGVPVYPQGASAFWHGWRILAVPGVGATLSVLVKNTSTSWVSFSMSNVQLGCEIDGPYGVERDSAFIGSGWTGIAPEDLRACERVRSEWSPFTSAGVLSIGFAVTEAGQGSIPIGTAFTFTFEVAGRYLPQGGSASAWSSWATVTAGKNANGTRVSGAVRTFTLPITGWSSNAQEVEIKCRDAVGEFQGQWFSTYEGSFTDIDANADLIRPKESDCYSATGLGWAPTSWVPGLVKLGGCVARSLFIPAPSSVTRLYDVGNEITEKAPISFVADSYALVAESMDGAPEAVAAHEDDCFDFLGGSPVFQGDEIFAPATGCGDDLASTELSDARELMGIGFWVGFGLCLLFATRKVIAGA